MNQTKSTTLSSRPAKGYKGIPMEGIVANWYAKIRQNDADIKPLVERISARLAPGSRFLEVAPGPGTLSIEVAKLRRYKVDALDISKTFVEMGQTNARAAGVEIDFRQGNASDMPFDDGTFNFIVCRAAFKNFTEPVRAIQEMYRVLKPGGKAWIIDLRSDGSPAEIEVHIKNMDLNPVNSFMTKITFQQFLLKNAYTPAQIRKFVATTDFKTCEIQTDAIGMEIELVKT